MKSKLINWKKKTGIYIGRFQPIHDGHFEIIKRAIKKNGQVAILVMNSFNFNKKNPFTYREVTKRINKKF